MNSNPSGLGKNEETEQAPNAESSTLQPQSAPEADVEPTQPTADAPDVPAEESTTSSSEPAPSEPTEAASPDDSAPAVETQPIASEEPAVETADAPKLQRGQIIENAIVKETSPTRVLVDLGDGIVGVVPGRELERMSRKHLERLQEGAEIAVFVVNPRTQSGEALLSVNRAIEEMDWRRAEEYLESKEVYESRVAGYNRGGLIVRFGRVRGFVPQSQLSSERLRGIGGETPEERWGGMVNEVISVKVMEVDRVRNRLILSERAAAREARERRKETLVEELEVGEIRDGRVVSLEDFGAFVDIGGAEGLVHLTELAWKHATHPREAVKVGQDVTVKVISVDRKNKRIGLSIKQLERDPWDRVAIEFEVGQLVRGRVTKLTKFGAFALLSDLPEVEGLIHISELSEHRVKHPREVVNEKDELTLRIVKMDIRDRRLGLSLKRVNSPEYLDEDLDRASRELEDEFISDDDD